MSILTTVLSRLRDDADSAAAQLDGSFAASVLARRSVGADPRAGVALEHVERAHEIAVLALEALADVSEDALSALERGDA